MAKSWEADPAAELSRLVGKSAKELGDSFDSNDCPGIWELSNGDFAIIGRNLTTAYATRLPEGVTMREDECLGVIPRNMMIVAKPDIPDA